MSHTSHAPTEGGHAKMTSALACVQLVTYLGACYTHGYGAQGAAWSVLVTGQFYELGSSCSVFRAGVLMYSNFLSRTSARYEVLGLGTDVFPRVLIHFIAIRHVIFPLRSNWTRLHHGAQGMRLFSRPGDSERSWLGSYDMTAPQI